MAPCFYPGSVLLSWLRASTVTPCFYPGSVLLSWLRASIVAPCFYPGFVLLSWLRASTLAPCFYPGSVLLPWLRASTLVPCFWLRASAPAHCGLRGSLSFKRDSIDDYCHGGLRILFRIHGFCFCYYIYTFIRQINDRKNK